MPDPRVIREKYCVTAPGYDELYRDEQWAKYRLVTSRYAPRGSMLDIGAGTCLFEEFITREGFSEKVSYIVALDLTDCMLAICRRRLRSLNMMHIVDIVVADAVHLPLRSKAFDTSYSFTVFDLTSDPREAIREMVRVTRYTGVYTLLKRAEKGRLYTLCEVYIGETDKDVACLPRALHRNNLYTGIRDDDRVDG